MDPVTLTTVKEIYDTAKAIQKVYNVSMEMKSVAESEGKDQIMATKNLAVTGINMKQQDIAAKGESSNKNLSIKEGDMLHGGNNGVNHSSVEFVEKLDSTREGYNPDSMSTEFVDKLTPEELSQNGLIQQDSIFVDKLSSNENIDANAENVSNSSLERDIEESNENTNIEHAGPEKITCINERYAGQNHPETGVPYVEKVVKTAEGKEFSGVFPQFESKFDAQLPKELMQESDSKQFAEANLQLKARFESDSKFASLFDERQKDDIKSCRTPYGYVWHHTEEIGKMQLVDYDTHDRTRHTGGKYIWGGGSSNR